MAKYVVLLIAVLKFINGMDVYSSERSRYTFVCPFRSDPGQVISWNGPQNSMIFAIGTLINPALPHKDRLNITGDTTNGEYNLQITNIQQSDGGRYACSGISGGGNPTTYFNLVVRGEFYTNVSRTGCVATNMVIDLKQSSITVTMNNYLVFVTIFTGFEDILITGNENYTNRIINYTVNRPKGDISFCIANTTFYDGGDYNITTLSSPNNKIVRLYVLGKPQKAEIIVKNSGIVNSEPAHLSCRSASTSAPSALLFAYVWTVNDTVIDDTTINLFGSSNELFINVTKNERKNKYMCFAKEEYGQVSDVSDTVRIDPKGGPEFNVDLPNSADIIRLKLAMSLNITVNLRANPIPSIQWIFVRNAFTENITSMSESSSRIFEYTAVMFIPSIQSTQFGSYVVIASNTYGNISQTFIVFQIVKPTAPTFIHVLCKATSAHLIWKAEFNGGSEQYFTVHSWVFGQLIPTTLQPVISDPGFHNDYSFIITDLIPSTNYGFLVLAVNEIGTSNSMVVNCTTDSNNLQNESSSLFAAGISALIIGILAGIVNVVWTYFRRLQRKRWKQTRSENYIELYASTPDKTDTYSTLQQTNELGKQKDNVSLYEECKVPTDKKDTELEVGVYSNMTI